MYGKYCIDDGFDSRRGKVNSMLLPPEDMLESFISNLTVRHQSWRKGKRNMFGRKQRVSVCKWLGVTCDMDQNVRRIEWISFDLLGSLQWGSLPNTLVACNLFDNKLGGFVVLGFLPPNLLSFTLTSNAFVGEISLTHLPSKLETIRMTDNQFVGSVDLTNLPSGLKHLYLNKNKFSGTVDLSHLPDLKYLYLSSNRFTGPLSLRHLSESLEFVSFHHNYFSGLVLFDQLPKSLIFLSVRNNRDLYGQIDSSVFPKNLRDIEHQNTEIQFKSKVRNKI